MSESKAHKLAKKKAAGKNGRTEVPLPGGRRLDALSANGETATEIERSGIKKLLGKAVERLDDSGTKHKDLKVPHKDLSKARKIASGRKTNVTVSKLNGTKKPKGK